jgi:hypothetical protein
VQLENAKLPIVVVAGKLTEVKLEQEANAALPIVVVAGKLTEVKLVQK